MLTSGQTLVDSHAAGSSATIAMADRANDPLTFGSVQPDEAQRLIAANDNAVVFGRLPVRRRVHAGRHAGDEPVTLPGLSDAIDIEFKAVAQPQGTWSTRLFAPRQPSSEPSIDDRKPYVPKSTLVSHHTILRCTCVVRRNLPHLQ
jgi:hypothetical protein